MRREAVFAGWLGRRVSESLVLARGDGRIVVRVGGSYHTTAVREGERLHAGDTVAIRGTFAETGATVARERILRDAS